MIHFGISSIAHGTKYASLTHALLHRKDLNSIRVRFRRFESKRSIGIFSIDTFLRLNV